MGWDAYCEPLGCSLLGKGEDVYILEEKKIMQKGYIVDGLLRFGGLDHDLCGTMLMKATKQNVWTETGWGPQKVRILADRADWNFEIEAKDEWARLSARAFLNTTARLERGIRFSF